MEAISPLRKLLIGRLYVGFSVYTTSDLDFDGFVLSFQEVSSADEASVTQWLGSNFEWARPHADPDRIAKSAILAACQGMRVNAVDLAQDAALTLLFENQISLTFPTNTAIVDWHWAITEEGRDPYQGCRFACFAPGEVLGEHANNSSKRTR